MGRGKWTSERHETAYYEARAILEAQQETIRDTDDKALRSSRLAVVLVGAVITATQPGVIELSTPFATVGAILFLLAFIGGMFTYDDTKVYVGPNRRYIKRMEENNLEKALWDEDLLLNLRSLIKENQPFVDRNKNLLSVVQGMLATGVILVAVSAVL